MTQHSHWFAAKTSTLKDYYQLTKPGIIYGNCISLIAGFAVATQRHYDWVVFAAAVVGTALVIAAACVLNNYIDRDIDKHMSRTKQRALVDGRIKPKPALLFAGFLSLGGFGLLALFTNILTVYDGLFGLYVYVVAYGLAKRRSPVSTLVGSVAGAMPIVAGYTAVSGRITVASGLLFLAMALWQMPHFYAIAMYRLDDYRSASIPVLPAVKGSRRTKRSTLAYVVAFGATTIVISLFGPTGIVYAGAMLVVSAIWLWKGVIGYASNQDIVWARRMFRFSLLVLLVFSALLVASPWLP